MKKNKLIELLQAIKGNPDVYLWNGHAEDWQNIDPKFIQEDFVIGLHKGSTYDLANPFVKPEERCDWYKPRKKKVVIINAQPRNKVSFGVRDSGLGY